MKVLQINKLYPPHLGGIENVVRDIAEELSRDQFFESEVLVCESKGPRKEEIINDVKIFRSASFGKLLSMPISFDFFRLFKKKYNNYDFILIHHPFPLASLAMFLFFNKKVKLGIWYHSDIVRQKLFYKLIYPFLYLDLKRASVIFVSSNRLAQKSPLLKKFLDKCVTIPFGVDLSIYKNEYLSEVKYLQSKYGRFMLSVGRLVYYKGYLDLLEAMKKSPGKLLIVGRGPLEKKMKNYIRKNQLEDRVFILTKKIDNLIPYYKACDFLVFSSSARSETFGLVQIEAMACGRPVINTNLLTGVPEVSVDKETGITVAVGDIRELSSAIKLLWENNSLLFAYGKNANLRVNNFFSKEKFNKEIKKNIINFSK